MLLPNGLRYPSRSTLAGGLVGGTRQRHFAGTTFVPRERPKNAAHTASRVVS
jgi:hypothetical protein